MDTPARRSPRTVAIAHASTADVPAAERLSYWEAHTAAELVGVRCSAYAAEGLVARQRNFDLGGLRLAEIAGNEHVVERARPALRRYPKDAVFASLLLEGEAFFFQRGRCLPLRAGDLVVYGTTTPYLYGTSGAMRQVQVDIAAEQLPRLAAPIHVDTSLRAGRLLTQPLRHELLDFVDAPWAERAPAAAQRIASLLEALIRSHGHEGGADLRLLRAEAYIAAHLADGELDAAAVARHLCVSPRHLNRLFEAHGCTATQWIWQQRLAAAHRMLCDPGHAAAGIGDIALQCGFATQAHFARAFRAAYGLTPSERRAGAGARSQGGCSPP